MSDKPLEKMTRDELRKVAAELKIEGRGKMLKPELIEAIRAATYIKPIEGGVEIDAQLAGYAYAEPQADQPTPAEKTTIVPNRADRRARGFNAHAIKREERARTFLAAGTMPYGERGRGSGAIHHLAFTGTKRERITAARNKTSA